MHLWICTKSEADLSLPLLLSSSPGPNKSCCFQREPPEGCEKVRVWEETSTPDQLKPAFISSCPDPNKVNFTPHGGSAFCPVSLLKPLLPSMDLLFRSLSVSPAGSCSSQGTSSCQATSSGNRAAPPDPPATAAADQIELHSVCCNSFLENRNCRCGFQLYHMVFISR
ncbi:Protein FAM117A [Larimichthys crocea]|uniref:Uncharacterized protein n=1 Tax=Larimichthys crocea TaxID=215358 RepID=A0ACD3RT68_LARCR|nr:Protein FAM117A [Larimichthys crocea]